MRQESDQEAKFDAFQFGPGKTQSRPGVAWSTTRDRRVQDSTFLGRVSAASEGSRRCDDASNPPCCRVTVMKILCVATSSHTCVAACVAVDACSTTIRRRIAEVDSMHTSTCKESTEQLPGIFQALHGYFLMARRAGSQKRWRLCGKTLGSEVRVLGAVTALRLYLFSYTSRRPGMVVGRAVN